MSVKTVYTCDGCKKEVGKIARTCSYKVPAPWTMQNVFSPGSLMGAVKCDYKEVSEHYCPDCWERMLSALEKVEA